MSLIPPIKFFALERRALLVLIIISLSKIMPLCSYCVKKKLLYIVIPILFSRQPSSYDKCTKFNMRSFCDI